MAVKKKPSKRLPDPPPQMHSFKDERIGPNLAPMKPFNKKKSVFREKRNHGA